MKESIALLVEMAKLRARNAELERQLAEANERARNAERSLEFSRNWNAERYERLRVWANEDLPDNLRHQFFNIIANGKRDLHENPTYAQLLSLYKHRAEQAEQGKEKGKPSDARMCSCIECIGNLPDGPEPDGWLYESSKGIDVLKHRISDGFKAICPPDMVEHPLYRLPPNTSALIEQAVREEREACAAICDGFADGWGKMYEEGHGEYRGSSYYEGKADAADYCSAAIRARGEK